MKTYDEFKKFFSAELLPKLTELETTRKQVIIKLIIWETIGLAATAALFLAIKTLISSLSLIYLVCILPCVGLGVLRLITSRYKADFKLLVIKKIIHFIEPNLKYRPADLVPPHIFRQSGIFLMYPDYYRGEDRVFGHIGKTEFQFSEIVAKERKGDEDEENKEKTFFRGLFFAADFNKHFSGRTFVFPDYTERHSAIFAKWLQSRKKNHGDLVKLEDPEFENLFVVYSDDQIEARYILTTALMEKLTRFHRKTGHNFYLSFANSRMHIAIPQNRNMFEPRMNKSIIDFAMCLDYFLDLSLVIGIVENLNLNTRIWTKK